MNDCSTCNSSLSDICYYVKITCSIKFQRDGHQLFLVFRAGGHHSLRSCLVLAGFARSCLALSPLRGEMTFITRYPGGKKPKDKSQESLLCRQCHFGLTQLDFLGVYFNNSLKRLGEFLDKGN